MHRNYKCLHKIITKQLISTIGLKKNSGPNNIKFNFCTSTINRQSPAQFPPGKGQNPNLKPKNPSSQKEHPSSVAMRQQPWYKQYQAAINESNSGNLIQALQQYYKVISIMQSKNQKGQSYYYQVFSKILELNVLLNRPLQTQENLYKLIKTKKQLNKNPILVFEDYQNLMIHQYHYNVEKAIKLGKALLSQSQINNLPLNVEKTVRLMLGNCYLLVDLYPDAKKKYSQTIEMKPQHNIKGMAYNNLAVACWWHKNPLFKPNFAHNIAYQETRINRDFKQTKQLLMNSIGALQNIDQMSQDQGSSLESLLNEVATSMLTSGNNKQESAKGFGFKSTNSLKAIVNLIQYYIYNDPIQKPLILAWMRILLRTAAKFNDKQIVNQFTSKYYLLNNDLKGLKAFLNTVLNHITDEQLQNGAKGLNSRNKSVNVRFNELQLLKMLNLVKDVAIQSSNQSLISNKISASLLNSMEQKILQQDPYILKRQFLLSQEFSFIKRKPSLQQ